MKKIIKKVSSSKPPEVLRKILEISKFIDPDSFFSVKDSIFDRVYELIEQEHGIDFVREVAEGKRKTYDKDFFFKSWNTLVKISKDCKIEKFVKYILKQFPVEEGYKEKDWFVFYSNFIDKYATLRSVAKTYSKMLAGKTEPVQLYFPFYGEEGELVLTEYVVPFFIPVIHVITTEGRLKPADSLLAWLYEADLKRLKICPVCGDLYWAYRANQKYCSRKCSNVFHQRKHLSDPENREQIKIKRKENHNYRKAVKEKK